MSGTKHLEDHILLSLLATVREDDDIVPKTTYQVYRSACEVIFSEVYNGLGKTDWEAILDEAFVEFWDQIQFAQIKTPLKADLMSYFLTILKKKAKKHVLADLATDFAMAEKQVYQYTGSEVLLWLIVKRHERTESKVSREFRLPAINTLKRYYGASQEQAEFVYNPAIAEGVKSIRQGSWKPPLGSKLFTFFFRIARNQLFSLYSGLKRNKEIPVDQDEALENLSPKDLDGRTYLDQLDDDHEVVKRFGVENLSDLLQKILELVTPEQRRYITMHHMDGLKYEEMVEILKEEGITVTVESLRKAVHDGLKKAKKNLI